MGKANSNVFHRKVQRLEKLFIGERRWIKIEVRIDAVKVERSTMMAEHFNPVLSDHAGADTKPKRSSAFDKSGE